MKRIVFVIVVMVGVYACISKDDNEARSIKLNDKANNIYMRIGIPTNSNDSVLIGDALMLLDSAIQLDSLNKSAYVNKMNILTSTKEYGQAISVIRSLQLLDSHNYYYFFLEGCALYKSEDSKKAFDKFTISLNKFDSKYANTTSENIIIRRAVLIAFLQGKESAIEYVKSSLDSSNELNLNVFIESVLESFEIESFIDNSIFTRSEQLK